MPQVLEAANARHWRDSPELLKASYDGRPLTALLTRLMSWIGAEDAELRSYQMAKARVKNG